MAKRTFNPLAWERHAVRVLLDRMLDLAGQARDAGRLRQCAAFEEAARRAMSLRTRIERPPSRRRGRGARPGKLRPSGGS